jgi:hypothetical protein
MSKKLIIAGFLMLVIMQEVLIAQRKSFFSGEQAKYREELTSFMGPNLNDEQKATIGLFLSRWDSAAYSSTISKGIMDVSGQLSIRAMRPLPHFYDFIATLNDISLSEKDDAFIQMWLKGLNALIQNPKLTNENIDRYFLNTSSLLRENILSRSGIVIWKVKGGKMVFRADSLFGVVISDATLTCVSQKDSTEIFNVSGIYYPGMQYFRGTKGTVTFEKAGYPRDEVFSDLGRFFINTTRNGFSVDSAMLNHKGYFKKPVKGKLSDQATSFSTPEKATFPRFETYTGKFRINNMFKGINYTGGLGFEGANVKGTGTRTNPAMITLSRNDTVFVKAMSVEFVFSKSGLNSLETAISLYLGKDSIYNSNLGFSYNADTRIMSVFRTSSPTSRSPYFNTYHNIDMYFEYLSWDLDESRIIMSRSRGAAMGQAQFESASFFNADSFMKLMFIDDYHPLNRLVKFAEFYYSETFPVADFAKWLNKPVDAVTGLCIDLANKGFLFFDKANNEITIKKKTHDFLNAFAKKKDYDVLRIMSETKAPLDNAVLNLKNFKLQINGVPGVFLSDSQKVAIFPRNGELVLGKNRRMEFNGRVEAGLFKVYGKDFYFSYDSFKVKLGTIDSILVAVESDKKDEYGRPVVNNVQNILQLGTAELFIDKPDNKSGLKGLKQYPILNAVTNSYIFYDKIPGLQNIYKKENFFFKIDPFTYENIDHYSQEDMKLAGTFYGGDILKPMKQYLTIQPNNSLGFNMIIPESGVEVYSGKGVLFENINMSSEGLLGKGTLRHLTSTTKSEEFRFFPDSMLTKASIFNIDKDEEGKYPETKATDVDIKWLPGKNEMYAEIAQDKNFSMFGNGTILGGSLLLTPSFLSGKGIINTADSRLTSNKFTFTSASIKADTANYNLKSTTSDGYAFIADNVKTDVDFGLKLSKFSLNTDSSVVKFPEIQYICKMTDFTFNMTSRVLEMEQKGKSENPLMNPGELLKLNFAKLDKPTFFATNSMSDTIAFSAWKGRYHLNEEYVEAENINYIHIADALIQPPEGRLIINRGAKIKPMENATIALNNRHILHTARINIESTKRYTGSAVYDYVDDAESIQKITFPELRVDTMTTTAQGFIPVEQKFMLSPAFSFSGDVTLSARQNFLTFTGSAGIVHNCSEIKSYSIKFKGPVDPKNVMIPVGEKPRDRNDNLVFSGSFINIDSVHIYPAFLSQQKSYTDVGLVNATGYLWFDKAKGRYLITSAEKIADPARNGNLIAFDKNFCTIAGEGKLNFGANFNLFKMSTAGKFNHNLDSGKVTIQALIGLDFYFSASALKIMIDELKMLPTLKAVNLNSELNTKGMKDLMGVQAASQIRDEMSLFGSSKTLPKEFVYKILLNDVTLKWNESTSSFRSVGKIGIGFIAQQPINVYVDGYIEIQRRRSGDMIDVYLKANQSTWYYFSYFSGVLMAQSANSSFNSALSDTKVKDRKDPNSTVRMPYTYMIAVETQLPRFLRRMASDSPDNTGTR